jgi:copper homeostasis protein
LDEGGTTPDPALIADVKRALRIPVFVLVRPRAGDFVYSADESTKMAESIRLAIDAGADGVVTGALTPEGRVDGRAMRTLTDAAGRVPLTFHRAFDHVRDQAQALEEIVQLGFARVLTSGGAPTASAGADALARLVELSGKRISIVAGGTVRAHNVTQIIERTGVREVHARLVDESTMKDLVDVVRMLE